jgi:hypothetical protein
MPYSRGSGRKEFHPAFIVQYHPAIMPDADKLLTALIDGPRAWLERDLAYIAGFLDGEGTFTVYKSSGRSGPVYKATLAASSTNRESIEWAARTFGGGVSALAKQGNRQNAFQWNMQDKRELVVLLPALLPFLRIKKLQAQLLLKYALAFQGARRGVVLTTEVCAVRDAYCQLFSALNGVGKESPEAREQVIRLFSQREITLP